MTVGSLFAGIGGFGRGKISGAATCANTSTAPYHYPVIGGHAAMAIEDSNRQALSLAMRVSIDETPRGCWVPCVKPARLGYVYLTRWVDGVERRLAAHRWSVQLTGRVIPKGWQIDHLCRNTSCCRPSHLDVVTPMTNTWRGNHPNILIRKSGRCKSGRHKLGADNVFPANAKNGWLVCRACALERSHRLRSNPKYHAQKMAYQREWRARRKAAQSPC